MRYLKSHYRICPLGEIVALLAAGKSERHVAAVTFDDGYRSNYSLAYPICRELQIPATIFVTSGFIQQEGTIRGFLWPDFVSAVVKSAGEKGVDLAGIGLGRYDTSSPAAAAGVRRSICDHLKSIGVKQRDQLLAGIDDLYGDQIRQEQFGDYQPLSRAELTSLATDPLITIGAHSRTHPILAGLDNGRLEEEMLGSKQEIEAITNKDVDLFAYPNGRRLDISRQVVALAARHFCGAVTTEPGRNHRGQNPYLLRRIGIGGDCGFGLFQTLISGAFDPARPHHLTLDNLAGEKMAPHRVGMPT